MLSRGEAGSERPYALEPSASQKQATYQEDSGLSCIYVYVCPKDKFPPGDEIVTEARTSEIVLDYERETGKLLGVEVITKTER